MCELVTAMAVTSGVISVGSQAYGAYRAKQQGKLAKAAGERNALIAEQAAGDAEQRGAVESGRVRSQGVYDRSKMVASLLMAGDGLVSVLTGMAINSETDAETVKNSAARQAWGFRNQADTARFEGETAQARADDMMIGDLLGAVGSAAGTAASVGAYRAANKPPAKDGLGIRDVPNSSRQLR